MKKEQTRESVIIRTSALGIAVNLLLALGKAFVGIFEPLKKSL